MFQRHPLARPPLSGSPSTSVSSSSAAEPHHAPHSTPSYRNRRFVSRTSSSLQQERVSMNMDALLDAGRFVPRSLRFGLSSDLESPLESSGALRRGGRKRKGVSVRKRQKDPAQYRGLSYPMIVSMSTSAKERQLQFPPMSTDRVQAKQGEIHHHVEIDEYGLVDYPPRLAASLISSSPSDENGHGVREKSSKYVNRFNGDAVSSAASYYESVNVDASLAESSSMDPWRSDDSLSETDRQLERKQVVPLSQKSSRQNKCPDSSMSSQTPHRSDLTERIRDVVSLYGAPSQPKRIGNSKRRLHKQTFSTRLPFEVRIRRQLNDTQLVQLSSSPELSSEEMNCVVQELEFRVRAKSKIWGIDHPDVVSLCSRMVVMLNTHAHRFLERGCVTEAFSSLELAMNLLSSKSPIQVAKIEPYKRKLLRIMTLNSSISLYRSAGQFEDALSVCDDLFRDISTIEDGIPLCSSAFNIASIFSEKGSSDIALFYFRVAMYVILDWMHRMIVSSEMGESFSKWKQQTTLRLCHLNPRCHTDSSSLVSAIADLENLCDLNCAISSSSDQPHRCVREASKLRSPSFPHGYLHQTRIHPYEEIITSPRLAVGPEPPPHPGSPESNPSRFRSSSGQFSLSFSKHHASFPGIPLYSDPWTPPLCLHHARERPSTSRSERKLSSLFEELIYRRDSDSPSSFPRRRLLLSAFHALALAYHGALMESLLLGKPAEAQACHSKAMLIVKTLRKEFPLLTSRGSGTDSPLADMVVNMKPTPGESSDDTRSLLEDRLETAFELANNGPFFSTGVALVPIGGIAMTVRLNAKMLIRITPELLHPDQVIDIDAFSAASSDSDRFSHFSAVSDVEKKSRLSSVCIKAHVGSGILEGEWIPFEADAEALGWFVQASVLSSPPSSPLGTDSELLYFDSCKEKDHQKLRRPGSSMKARSSESPSKYTRQEASRKFSTSTSPLAGDKTILSNMQNDGADRSVSGVSFVGSSLYSSVFPHLSPRPCDIRRAREMSSCGAASSLSASLPSDPASRSAVSSLIRSISRPCSPVKSASMDNSLEMCSRSSSVSHQTATEDILVDQDGDLSSLDPAQMPSLMPSNNWTDLSSLYYCAEKTSLHDQDVSSCLRPWRGVRWEDICSFLLFPFASRAAIVVQQRWRGYAVRSKMSLRRKNVIILQRMARGMLIRRVLIPRMRRASDRLIAFFRGVLARKGYRFVIARVKDFQRYLRWWLTCGRSLRRLTKLSIFLQSCFRRHVVHVHLVRMNAAATKVQKWIRRRHFLAYWKHIICLIMRFQARIHGFLCRRNYQRIARAVSTLQGWFRGVGARRKRQRGQFAVIRLQGILRGHLVREMISSMERSCLIVQRYTRGYLERKLVSVFRKSIISVQALFRGCFARRKIVPQRRADVFERMITMESVERTVTMTKRNAAVVTLQSCIRRFMVKNRIRTFLLSLVCIQCHIRGWAVRRNLRSRFRAAVIIQRIWRGAFIRRKTINIDSSCRVVQRMWRGFLERRKLRVRNVMSLFMQRQLRLWISRRGFSRVLNSEVSVARYIRGKYNRIQFKHSRLAAICIQRCVRGWMARSRLKILQSGVQKFQALYRAWVDRRRLELTLVSVKRIQLFLLAWIARRRGTLVRKSLHKLRKLVVRIETEWRRKRFIVELEAARNIQRVFRGFRLRSSFRRMVRACSTLQRQFRGRQHLSRSDKILRSVVLLQAQFRGFLVRQKSIAKTLSSVSIQRVFRSFLTRKSILLRTHSALHIQRFWMERKCFAWIRIVSRSVIHLQALFRGYISRNRLRQRIHAAKVIQGMFWSWKLRKFQYCIRLIQSFFRSCCARNHRHRIQAAAQKIQHWWLHLREQDRFFRIVWAMNRIRRLILSTIRRKRHRHEVNIHYFRGFVTNVLIPNTIFTSAYSSGRIFRAQSPVPIVAPVVPYRGQSVSVRFNPLPVNACRYPAGLLLESWTIAARTIQFWYRAVLCRSRFLQSRRSCIIVQRWIREVYHRRKQGKVFDLRSQAICGCASELRDSSREAHVDFDACAHAAAITIQRVYRGNRERRELKYRVLDHRVASGAIASKHNSTTASQISSLPHFLALEKTCERALPLVSPRKSVLCSFEDISSTISLTSVNQESVQTFVVALQAAWRGRKTRHRYVERDHAARAIQKIYSLRFIRRNTAARIIQRLVRKHQSCHLSSILNPSTRGLSSSVHKMEARRPMSRTKKRMRGVDIDTNMLVLFRIREAEDLHSIQEWLAHHPSTRFHPWQFVEEALSQAHSKRKKASSPLDHSCLAGDLAEPQNWDRRLDRGEDKNRRIRGPQQSSRPPPTLSRVSETDYSWNVDDHESVTESSAFELTPRSPRTTLIAPLSGKFQIPTLPIPGSAEDVAGRVEYTPRSQLSSRSILSPRALALPSQTSFRISSALAGSKSRILSPGLCKVDTQRPKSVSSSSIRRMMNSRRYTEYPFEPTESSSGQSPHELFYSHHVSQQDQRLEEYPHLHSTEVGVRARSRGDSGVSFDFDVAQDPAELASHSACSFISPSTYDMLMRGIAPVDDTEWDSPDEFADYHLASYHQTSKYSDSRLQKTPHTSPEYEAYDNVSSRLSSSLSSSHNFVTGGTSLVERPPRLHVEEKASRNSWSPCPDADESRRVPSKPYNSSRWMDDMDLFRSPSKTDICPSVPTRTRSQQPSRTTSAQTKDSSSILSLPVADSVQSDNIYSTVALHKPSKAFDRVRFQGNEDCTSSAYENESSLTALESAVIRSKLTASLWNDHTSSIGTLVQQHRQTSKFLSSTTGRSSSASSVRDHIFKTLPDVPNDRSSPILFSRLGQSKEAGNTFSVGTSSSYSSTSRSPQKRPQSAYGSTRREDIAPHLLPRPPIDPYSYERAARKHFERIHRLPRSRGIAFVKPNQSELSDARVGELFEDRFSEHFRLSHKVVGTLAPSDPVSLPLSSAAAIDVATTTEDLTSRWMSRPTSAPGTSPSSSRIRGINSSQKLNSRSLHFDLSNESEREEEVLVRSRPTSSYARLTAPELCSRVDSGESLLLRVSPMAAGPVCASPQLAFRIGETPVPTSMFISGKGDKTRQLSPSQCFDDIFVSGPAVPKKDSFNLVKPSPRSPRIREMHSPRIESMNLSPDRIRSPRVLPVFSPSIQSDFSTLSLGHSFSETFDSLKTDTGGDLSANDFTNTESSPAFSNQSSESPTSGTLPQQNRSRSPHPHRIAISPEGVHRYSPPQPLSLAALNAIPHYVPEEDDFTPFSPMVYFPAQSSSRE